jgi:muramoyltetrapeptide carboxypeptidase
MAPLTRPPPLFTGARIRIVAASSPFEPARFERGLQLLGARYRPECGQAVFARHGFLAGSDAQRAADLCAALDDAEVRAIVPPRGGYGATRLLPALDLERVRRSGAWLVGFSDVTALHALWARAGLCSIHGAMVCSLPEASPALQAAWFALLEGAAPPPLEGLTTVHAGQASGRLFGGNLTVLAALMGTPYLPDLTDTVLILEDVGERPYRLDRVLTTLLQAGTLAGVRAVVLGQFSDSPPGADGVRVDQVLAERLGQLGIPVVANAPFGHIAENTPLLLGALAHVDADAGRVAFTAP